MVLSPAPVVVTGADGFIGTACCRRMQARGQPVRRFVHRHPQPGATADVVALDLARAQHGELTQALRGAFAVVHLAGRAHVMNEVASDAEAAYTCANADATKRLALAAVAAGVRRFVLASTVKVNGESTRSGQPFKPTDPAAPRDAYARSKLAAELALARAVTGAAISAATLRLPLVYGRGARGNFRRLVDAVAARRLLPLGAIDNRRSLLAIDNLLDAIDAVLAAPSPVSGTHFVADADAIATPALVRAIAAALGVAPRLLSVPVPALRLAGALSGCGEAVARLTNSLEVDTTSLSAATGWRPRPVSIDAASVGTAGPSA
jgi:UDP-N-acetyl-alpha-D-quinovosamine dehydrogenase